MHSWNGLQASGKRLYDMPLPRLNASSSAVIAADIPSGADADAIEQHAGTIARANCGCDVTAPRPAHVFAELTRGQYLLRPLALHHRPLFRKKNSTGLPQRISFL